MGFNSAFKGLIGAQRLRDSECQDKYLDVEKGSNPRTEKKPAK